MRISVVVCTRDRAARLRTALDAWEQVQFEQPWELIVVVNASTDATADVVAAFCRETALRTVALNQPRPGVCAARNMGWRGCSGGIVAFVDDDCYPAPDFLAQLELAFDQADLGYVGGQMRLFDAADLPFLSIQTRATRCELRARSAIRAGLIHGGNMAFRRDVLEAIGGFDECLGAGTPARSGGDVDALALASSAGYAGAYEPRIVVLHHHGRKTAAEGVAVMTGYDIGRGAFFVKCLRDPRRRGLYVWPIMRRLAGHLIRRRFGMLGSELKGASIYLRCVAGQRQGQANPTLPGSVR